MRFANGSSPDLSLTQRRQILVRRIRARDGRSNKGNDAARFGSLTPVRQMAKRTSRDRDRFARIPVEVMQSEAVRTAPHAAFRVLAILIAGNVKERNGTFACSDSYAATFGLTSKETLHRSLVELQERGLIVRTRQGMKMRRWPTLWAVTWWPIFNRDGRPLDRPEEPTHAYAKWKPSEKKLHTDSRGAVTPIIGVSDAELHPDSTAKSTASHPDGRGNSRSGSGGKGSGRELSDASDLVRAGH